METRRIGSLTVSVVAVGCTTLGRELDEAASARLVDEAIDAGINFFDTADGYGQPRGQSEINLGLALQGGKRDKVIVASKFGSRLKDGVQQPGGGKAEAVRASIEGSLKRLRTDRIDLIQMHRPDPGTPIAETLGVLRELQKQGKIIEIGSSNFTATQLAEAAAVDGRGFVSVQNEYNALNREAEAEVLPYCARTGTAFMPYYPVANGLLTGKYRKHATTPAGARLTDDATRREQFLNERLVDMVEELIAYAKSRGHTVLELAFAWLLATPSLASAVTGMRTGEQARSNVAAAGAWKLTREEKQAIDVIVSKA
jgi:aryl-alcohol dehydrogenase-like predicted oxidoreductase